MVHDNNKAHDRYSNSPIAASSYYANDDIAVQHNNIYATTNDYLKKHGPVNIFCRNKVHNDGRLIVEDRSAAVNDNIDLKDLLESACQKKINLKKEKKKQDIVIIKLTPQAKNDTDMANQASQPNMEQQQAVEPDNKANQEADVGSDDMDVDEDAAADGGGQKGVENSTDFFESKPGLGGDQKVAATFVANTAAGDMLQEPPVGCNDKDGLTAERPSNMGTANDRKSSKLTVVAHDGSLMGDQNKISNPNMMDRGGMQMQ